MRLQQGDAVTVTLMQLVDQFRPGSRAEEDMATLRVVEGDVQGSTDFSIHAIGGHPGIDEIEKLIGLIETREETSQGTSVTAAHFGLHPRARQGQEVGEDAYHDAAGVVQPERADLLRDSDLQELSGGGATIVTFTVEVIVKDVSIEQDQYVRASGPTFGGDGRIGAVLGFQSIVIGLEAPIVIEEGSELLESCRIGVIV
jgi:hypothetical protein